jgi:hypothetical protein
MVKKSHIKATATYRQLNPEKVAESFKTSSTIYNQNYPEEFKIFKKENILKEN